MSPRVLAAALATLSVVAFAQSDDYSPPPMVPVDPPAEATPDQPELVPQSGQPVQPIPADPQQQPDQQQPQYQPYPQQQQYQYAQPPPQQPAKPKNEPVFEGTPFESTRSKHFLALASASPGVFAEQLGSFALNVRAEADIGRIPLFVGYTGFFPNTLPTSISHFTAMTGWSFFSSDEITWRALTGVDVISDDGLVGTGVVFGSTLRAMARSIGFDAAIMFTPFPFRQLELRAAFVVQFWRVFELQLGWRYQAIDATQGGDLSTLFNIAPAVNGPAAGIGLTF